MDSKAYWVGFNRVKGIGAVRMQALLNHFGSLEIAWQAPLDGLVNAGLSLKVAQSVVSTRRLLDLEQYMASIARKGIQVITREEAAYPRRVKQIDQPPPVLYVRGSLIAEDDLAIAVVGTRRVTPYGRQVAGETAAYLAAHGLTIVSGLARGVDSMAHEAALNAGGRTIAVLGSGVDQIYPPEHARLAGQIMEHGAVISDYAPGTPPDWVNFPPRNRIISGLSMGVVVIEAGETSGALITAEFAAEQGREVFAIPGNIQAPQSKGTNRLIQQGAHPLLRPSEVLEVLDMENAPELKQARTALPTDPTEARLMSVLTREPTHVDDIRERSGLPIEIVSATLALMELKGLARQVGAMQYVAARENQSDYRVEKTDE